MSQYKLHDKLGQGGMGMVFRATHLGLKRDVAIKFLLEDIQDEERLERFRREIQSCICLNHPNIIKILDSGQQDDRLYYVMELVDDGVTLDKLLKESGPLPPSRVADLSGQLLDALDYAHQNGFIHRDVKPTNVMVRHGDHVVLMDFGLVKAEERTVLTAEGRLLGTPRYMAPELFSGEPPSPASDVFAAGAMTYEMLTGKHPFSGKDIMGVVESVMNDVPTAPSTLRPDLPPGTDTLVTRLLSRDLEVRYSTAREASTAMAQWKSGLGVRRTGRLRSAQSGRPSRRLATASTDDGTGPSAGDVAPERPSSGSPGSPGRGGGSGPGPLSLQLTAFGLGLAVVLGAGWFALRGTKTPILVDSSPKSSPLSSFKAEWGVSSLDVAWTSPTPYAASVSLTATGAGSVVRAREPGLVRDHRLTVAPLQPGTEYRVEVRSDATVLRVQSGQTRTVLEGAARLVRVLKGMDLWGVVSRVRQDYLHVGSRSAARDLELRRQQDSAVARRWTAEFGRSYAAHRVADIVADFSRVKDPFFGDPAAPLGLKRDLYLYAQELYQAELLGRLRSIPVTPLASQVLSEAYGPTSTSTLPGLPRALTLEWTPGFCTPQLCPSRDNRLLPVDPHDHERFSLYQDRRGARWEPGRVTKDLLVEQLGHWYSEPAGGLPFDPPEQVQMAEIAAGIVGANFENAFRIFLMPPGSSAWMAVADLYATGPRLVWTHTLDPRLLVPGSRLRVEFVYCPERVKPEQRQQLHFLSFRWLRKSDGSKSRVLQN